MKHYRKAICIASALLCFSLSGYAQRVTLNMRNVTVKQAMNQLTQSSGYAFVFSSKDINPDKRVSVSANNADINAVVRQILRGQNHVSYEIKGKNIIVSRSAGGTTRPSLVRTSSLQENTPQQDRQTITGQVVDMKGEPVIGASVKVKGTRLGTITNFDGRFSLKADEGSTLVISYIGYDDKEVAASSGTALHVALQEHSKSLDEVVVVGYGVQKKVNLTGSVASVDAKTIEDIPASNLTSALSGRLAGVNITQTAGKPGGGSSLSIRADGTWNSTAPLYVIDGVVRDKFAFDGLDASEVENLSVLKDGASAAIYGSRAANGVVLVTTKKGKKGKPQISYTGSIGFSNPTKIPKVFNAYEQATYINESLRNDLVPEGDNRYYTEDELDYFKTHSYDLVDMAYKTPVVTRHSVNVSGGNEWVRYFIGGNYYYETGSFKNLNFKKYSFRSNIDANITKDLVVSLGLSTDSRNDHKPYWKWDNDNDNMANLFQGLLRRGLYIPYIDGKPNGTILKWHPMEVVNGKTGYNKKNYTNYEINVGLKYSVPFIKGLNLSLTYNRYERHTFIKQFNRPYPLYVFKTTGQHNHIPTNEVLEVTKRDDGDFLYEKYNKDYSYQLNAMATYNRQFGKHEINALFVYEQSESTNDWLTGQRNYFISSAVDQMFAGSSDPKNSTVDGSGSETGRISYVGRLGYTYADKYLLEASFRYDGSVNFAPGHRWGFFPSVSAGWRISTEKEVDITEKWVRDSAYTSQRNYELKTPCILDVSPKMGPDKTLNSNETFTSFSVYEMPFDSFDRERKGLFTRRMNRVLTPWATQNPIFMHLTSTNPEVVHRAVDQCAETGYEMIILSFGSGLNAEDISDANIAKFKGFVDYAKSKGIEMGCYSLLASRWISDSVDVINPKTGKRGGMTFGSSPCLCSQWGYDYFQKIKTFFEKTGMRCFENDGSYPGDFCASTHHAYHKGLKDSQWNQFYKITELYHWMCENGIYLNVPDYYFLNGSTKVGIGYREVNWSLPRERQLIHTRQLNYDCTWDRLPSALWSFVPLVEYQGGGAAATIEPLHEHLFEYKTLMFQNYSSGIQACYRGPRLYDTPETKKAVIDIISWYKKYRTILNSDIIHLRKPDARDWDGLMHVNPQGKEKGLAIFYNPTDEAITRQIVLPLYYTGIQSKAMVREQEKQASAYNVSCDKTIRLTVKIPARGYTWYVIE